MFNDLCNPSAHEPIVDRELFKRTQAVFVPRGRQTPSGRLLARLGVLRCGNCGARMVASTNRNGQYPSYRCPAKGKADCKQRLSISATYAENTVTEWVRARVADMDGQALAETGIRSAEEALERAEAALRAAVQTLTGFEDVEGARAKLDELRASRDTAAGELERLGGAREARAVLNASKDWDQLLPEGKRALIRATVGAAMVNPGRGPDGSRLRPRRTVLGEISGTQPGGHRRCARRHPSG